MYTTRRAFLQTSAAVGGALGLGIVSRAFSDDDLTQSADQHITKAEVPLRILILGGTGFLGPHQVRYAISRGHTVTLFNRGKTNPHLFPALEKLRGDRDGDLEALKGREWDVVIDNSGYVPRVVRDSAELLKDAVSQYLFISTLSVHSDFSQMEMNEDSPVGKLDDPTVEEVTGQTYGPLKALCEQEVQRVYGDRATVIRPHLIAGPGDSTDRFTYWPVRIDRGGEVLAPGDPTDRVQYIDVRDLAGWCVRMVEQGHGGLYSAAGPEAPLTIGELLYGIRAVTSADVSFTWVDADFLAEHNVRPWSDMPIWIPPRDGFQGFATFSRERAMGKGLTYRPLAETAKDTLDWWKTLDEERRSKPRAGLAPERESEVLAAFHAPEGA